MSGEGAAQSCPSDVAQGRTDRCGYYAYPQRCSPARCSLVDPPPRPTWGDEAAALGTHTRVASVKGPAFCCKECSLSVGEYVEWPCVASFRASGFHLLDRIAQSLAPTEEQSSADPS